jgi:phospholipid transport system substrate-binding protein
MRSWRTSIALTLMVNLALAVPWAIAGPPTDTVQKVIGDVLDIMKNPAYQGSEGKTRRRQLVKEAVETRFDFREMSRLSLGPTWNTLSGSQRDDFVRLFGDLMEVSYSDKIEKYIQHVKVDYTGELVEGNTAEVKTIVIRANDRIPINYRLKQEAGSWKIYDVVIEGVSMVNNYRSQFGRIIRESSYTQLVSRLRTRVNELRRMGM